MENLVDKINLDESLKNKVSSLIENDKNRIEKLANECKEKGFKTIFSKDDLTKLAVCLEYSKFTFEKYKELGIDENIFFDTMKDISIWCENNDNKGLKNISWIQNHLKSELFRIGRLQYQLYVCNNPSLDYDKLPFNKNDKMIFVHIPQGEKLEYSKCIESLKSAKEFFEKYFPDWEYRFFICESWLMYGENFQFMEPSSNILQFQSLFTIEYSVPDDRQAIERIFGKRHIFKALYPANTSLQKSAKTFMLKGGKLGSGIGLLDKSEI